MTRPQAEKRPGNVRLEENIMLIKNERQGAEVVQLSQTKTVSSVLGIYLEPGESNRCEIVVIGILRRVMMNQT